MNFWSCLLTYIKDEIMEWKGDLSVFKPAYNLLRTSAKSKKKLKLVYNKKEKR
ncbi:MAG: hypothetical protein ACTSSP_04330 [Candidatus Asgardarchaeia archaeon]